MKGPKYKNQKIKNFRKLIGVFIVLIFILILVSFFMIKTLESNTNNELTYDNLTTIKEVIEYYESTYISENESEDKEFYIDVYLKFKFLPYDEQDNSNEEYYNSLIADCAKVIRHRSFKLIDNENDIIVKVICDGSKIISVIINDIEDYFIYMDSQISLKKYVEIPNTTLNIQSPILQSCIDNNWNDVISFGERDSIFDEYYIYFDEGLKVRTINGKIYNIIFTKQYNGNIVDDLFTGIDLESIEERLGEAAFKDEEKNVIGYKDDRMYIFFTETEVSVYRNTTVDIEDFFDLVDKFLIKEIELLDFMNELTYIWPDYSDYEYGSDFVFLSYPLKGLEIQINYDDINGILLYNNIKASLPRIEQYLQDTNFVSRLKLDLVFETEKRRVSEENSLIDKCKEYKESLDEETKQKVGENLQYELYPMKDKNGFAYAMHFISSTRELPNRELNDYVDSYVWYKNDYFIYSKQGKGIFLYNLLNGTVQRIITGDEEFNIKGIENTILKYDNQQLELQY